MTTTEAKRMKRIAELMNVDPALGTPEGEELSRLADEQIACENSPYTCDKCSEKVLGSMDATGWFNYQPHECSAQGEIASHE
jgi:hypothetical protein